MGLRTLYNAIDDTLNEWWRRMSVRERILAVIVVFVAWACVLVGILMSAFAAYLNYLIRTGQFID